ncbi:MobA/MobL family protein [Asaia sp. BMEF1]|uniref:MobA/MobL family protein n=1 Tax=Asaia sp. BMEF1 TaxID=3155932 RepID=UPI003F66AF14
MALYSLQHSSIAATDGIGKTAARLQYICCNRQDLILLGARHGLSAYDTTNLRTLAERHETMAGQNGRIAECFIIALPREGTPELHQYLVRDFAEKVTHGTAPWIAAIHYDRPGNPHVHLIALEQNKPRTGGKGRPSKVIGLSRKGALERVREEWAETHNRIMAGTGPPIDHRSLEDRGKGHLLPTLHEGPAARIMQAQGKRPVSQTKTRKNGQTIDWPQIDEGRTRSETNTIVRRINALASQLEEQGYERRHNRVFPAPSRERGPCPTANRTSSTPPTRTPHGNGAHYGTMPAPSGAGRGPPGQCTDPTVPVPSEANNAALSPALDETHADGRLVIPHGDDVRVADALKSTPWRYSPQALHEHELHLVALLRQGWDTMRSRVRHMINAVDWARLSSNSPRRPQKTSTPRSLWPSFPKHHQSRKDMQRGC